jgi:hypothetical protein
MNILDIQDKLKGLSEDQLAKEMQMPTGSVPQFLVLGEMNRRQSMRQSMQQQGAGSQTVAQELLNGAGIPAEGMSDMAGAMAPKSSIAQNTGIGALPQEAPPSQQAGIESLAMQQPTGMKEGGRVKHYKKPDDDSKSKGSERDRTERNFPAMYGIDDKPVKSADYELLKWVANALNPVENAKSAYKDAMKGDIVGAGMNAASMVPYGSGISLLAKLGMQAAPSVYDDMRGNSATGMYAGGPVMKMSEGSQGAVSALPSWLSGDIFGREITPYDPARKESEYGSHRVVDGYQLKMMQDQEARARALDQPPPPVDPRVSGNPATTPEAQAAVTAAKDAIAENNTPPQGNPTGGNGGGSKMSTYEQMLQDAMANAEKKAKQDKWLALAQAGMALMSSTQPNLAGAIGEAGKVGIEALQSARDTGTATQLELAKQQFLIDEDRNARARAAASAGRPKPRTASGILSEISSINEILSGMTQEDATGMPITPDKGTLATMADLKAQADALIAEYGRLQASGADLSDGSQ